MECTPWVTEKGGTRGYLGMQAVGPVAVTSLLLGSGLKDTISSDVQADPNNPADPEAQMEYNMAAIQVSTHALPWHAENESRADSTSMQIQSSFDSLFWLVLHG